MKPVKNKNYVILDTNIIQYLHNESLATGIIECLREAINAEYGLAISDFTIFELLNGLSIQKEPEIVATLNNLTRFYVKKSILIAAAHLGCLYKDDGLDHKKIDSGDLIIAATSALSGSLIFTANVRDFPAPFFKEVVRRPIAYVKNDYPAQLFTAFIRPDLDFIAKCHETRVAPLSKAS